MNMPAQIPQSWSKTGQQPKIAIIGAGMSGIAAVVKFRKAGYTDLTVFEKSDRVGGTWRENTYPGLSCDVPSRWYSFSFNLKHDWKNRYSYGPDIQAYMEETAAKFKVTDVIRFNTPIADVRYIGPHWQLTTGEGEVLNYDIVISATGVLHQPVTPDIPGLDSFAGDQFHTARWDHSVALKGKRVGIVGTGSTAAQVVGAITAEVGEMKVFQRTPQWMAPLPQTEYSAAKKWLMKTFPLLMKLGFHFYFQLMLLTFAEATIGNKRMQRFLSWYCLRNLEKNVPDPELRKKLTPEYQAACKRLIFCSDFYPAISQDHAHLITDAIECITPKGIKTVDGKEHELDVLVMATGFNPAAFILPTEVTGEGGVTLSSAWDGAPRAHRAVALPGFPNFWMLEGPTGPVGNLSLITISEYQIDYIISMMDKMKADGLAAVAVREEAFKDYNAGMQQAVKKTVWVTGGCTSWYMDKTGTPNLYPYKPAQYLNDMQNPVFAEYRLMQEVETSPELHQAA